MHAIMPVCKSDDMKVEPFRSKIRWADLFECYEADDKLWIIGDLWEEGATDLMNAYEAADGSPHVQFANGFSDEKLTEFTAIYGHSLFPPQIGSRRYDRECASAAAIRGERDETCRGESVRLRPVGRLAQRAVLLRRLARCNAQRFA
jgi:hypothetical protein